MVFQSKEEELLSSSPASVLNVLGGFSQKKREELSLEEFLEALPRTIEQAKNETSDAPKTAADTVMDGPIAKLMEKLVLDPEDYELYARFDPSKNYTRNLVATDGRLYTLILLCWNPGRKSPIHDHPCDGCWFQVLKGSVQECRYVKDSDTDTMKCVSEEVYREGQFSYITDSMGYHKVINPSPTVPAITLHLYCPPFQTCKIWMDPNHASKPSQSCVCYHSEYAVIV